MYTMSRLFCFFFTTHFVSNYGEQHLDFKHHAKTTDLRAVNKNSGPDGRFVLFTANGAVYSGLWSLLREFTHQSHLQNHSLSSFMYSKASYGIVLKPLFYSVCHVYYLE